LVYVGGINNLSQATVQGLINANGNWSGDKSAYNTTAQLYNIFATSGSVINNAARVFGANYRMFLDVYALQGSNYKKVAALDGVPDLSQQVNFRELPMLVDALIPNNLPNISGNIIFGALNFLKVRLKLCDYYGEPPTEQVYNYYPASGYFITLQGAAAQKQITDNYLLDYFIGSTLKMLTAMKSGSTVLHNTQRQYLSVFVPNGTGSSVTVTVKVKLFYTDGTNSADLSTLLTGSHQREQIISVGVGYTQLGIAALKDADKTVSHYEVFFTIADVGFTERFKFKVDYDYYRNSRYFLFFNSFGQYEILWVRGEQSTEVEYSTTQQDLAFTVRNESANVYYGNKTDSNIFYENKHKIASGTRAKWELNYVKEFFASKNKFLIEGNKLIAITTGNVKLNLGADDDTLFTFEFTYMPAMEERGNA
jgi:hypothetical protein